jgi:RimJ/RimL family protein N-acetyltransferase
VLTGERVVLRAPTRDDVEPEHVQTDADYALHAIVATSEWRPVSIDSAVAQYEKRLAEPADPTGAWFSVARRDDPELTWIGRAGLWGINDHQRTAHLGITLAPSARGQGLGTDIVRVLCDYAFRVRDLHRLGLETLADNQGMLKVARATGFVEEGRLREAAYVLGDRVDEVQLGLLRSEWIPRPVG